MVKLRLHENEDLVSINFKKKLEANSYPFVVNFLLEIHILLEDNKDKLVGPISLFW